MTTPKLKQGAEELINSSIAEFVEKTERLIWEKQMKKGECAFVSREKAARWGIDWTLANLPKLLEATHQFSGSDYLPKEYRVGNLPVAIIVLEENAKQEVEK